MKGYILKGEDTSRDAIEAKPRIGMQDEAKGITLRENVAVKWEESAKHRSFEEVPVMEAKEEVTYTFGEKSREDEE